MGRLTRPRMSAGRGFTGQRWEGKQVGAVAGQGWEPGGNPSQVPRKGRLTAMGRGNVPAEPEVGDGQQPRTLGRKEPTPQEVVLTAGEQGDVRAWALSCRETHVRSVPQPRPGEGGPQSPKEPPLMTISRRLSLSWGQSSWEQGRPHRVSGAGGGRCAGRQPDPGTVSVSSALRGSSRASPARQVVSAAPGPARTSRRSGW